MTSIGGSAFKGCSSLTSVTIPNGVTSIDGSAFYGCSSLTSFTIPNGVTRIGPSAFYGCSGLTSFTIPNSVTSIGNDAFSETEWYNNQPDGILYLNHWLLGFKGEKPTGKLVIAEGTKGLASDAFYGCSGLTSVTIPSSVTSIGYYAFYGCSGLTSVHISDLAAWCHITFKVEKDYPSNPLYYAHHLYLGDEEIKDLVIPNSVTSIGQRTFESCSSLISVTIPNSVTSIEDYAFNRCSGLTSVTIGSGVKDIYYETFASCQDLTDVYCLAEKVPNTDTHAFRDSNIEYATLHVPAASINDYKTTKPWKSFKEIKSLTDEDIPVTPEPEKCATPTIDFVDGKLTFGCETEDVKFVYDIKSTYSVHGVGSEVLPVCKCTVTVYATRQDYYNSDVATMEFTLSAGGDVCDTNKDGAVDVADISAIITRMAEMSRRQEMRNY